MYLSVGVYLQYVHICHYRAHMHVWRKENLHFWAQRYMNLQCYCNVYACIVCVLASQHSLSVHRE